MVSTSPRHRTATAPDVPDLPRELDTRTLVRRGLLVALGFVALGLVALLAPGLGEVRRHLAQASPWWIALAVLLEVLSSLSYVAMFRPAFCPTMSWRSTSKLALSELAVGSIVPASGAGGVALGAWVLTHAGMPLAEVTRRSIAFLLIKSGVNFVAVAILGVVLWLGLGPELSPALTILGTAISIGILIGVPALARLLARAGARGGRRLRAVASALHEGVKEAARLLRSRHPLLYAGAIGYWLFDNLVLLVTFHAFGLSPNVLVVFMAYLCGQLGGALPLPGGLGGIDAGLLGALVLYGIDPAGAAAAVIAYRVILFWVPIVMGAPAFWFLRRGLDDVTPSDAPARRVGGSVPLDGTSGTPL